MRRSLSIWLAFAFCLAVVSAAMGYVSLAAVRAERAEAETRRQAELEEKVRLALWRIDATLAPLVAQESVRPWFCYQSFFPAERLANWGPEARRQVGVSVPSPLLAAPPRYVLVSFQFDAAGRLSSPQVPAAADRTLAVPHYVSRAQVRQAERRLADVADLANRAALSGWLPKPSAAPVEVVISPLWQPPAQQMAQQKRRAELQQEAGQGAVEYEARNNMVQSANSGYSQAPQVQQAIAPPAQRVLAPSAYSPAALGALEPTDTSGTPMTPLCLQGRLLLARRVSVGGQEYVQGCLLDWPELRQSLLDLIADLLPRADLQPVASGSGLEQAHMVAALPLRLLPGRQVPAAPGRMSPIMLSLLIAWACVLLAGAAVAGLLAGVMRLSARRAAFVSAVTHELRTPLTTFQMYAEMLAEGMVPEGPSRQQYLETLRGEAGRLIHLVENVLAYARLERGRSDGRREVAPLEDLLAAIRPRLADHAARTGMELVFLPSPSGRESRVGRAERAPPQEASGRMVGLAPLDPPYGCFRNDEVLVRTNPAAVEQILLNLVDNACKYAAGATDRRIHLGWRQHGRAVEISVSDHGPGVSRPRRRLFRSFSKTAQEAAHSAPGIGLGLALSRRLARAMGGDLHLEKSQTPGACFTLTLPVAQET